MTDEEKRKMLLSFAEGLTGEPKTDISELQHQNDEAFCKYVIHALPTREEVMNAFEALNKRLEETAND